LPALKAEFEFGLFDCPAGGVPKLHGDPPPAGFPGVGPDIQPEWDPATQVPGWPVGPLVVGRCAKAVRVPKADSMTTTTAEAITAARIFCIGITCTSKLYKENTRIPLLGFRY